MANLGPLTITLKVNIQFTRENVRRLIQTIHDVHGAQKVEVEAQHGLFRIIGKVNPRVLIRYLENEGIKTELVMFENDESDTSSDSPNPGEYNFQDVPRAEMNHGRGRPEKEKKRPPNKKKEEKEHVCEPYDQPKIDPQICPDIYYKLHKSRATFHDKVPSLHSEDHPRHNMHGHGHSFAGNHPYMYGGGGFPMMMPPRPYPSYGGFSPARNQMPAGYPNFGYYGHPDVNFRGPPRPYM